MSSTICERCHRGLKDADSIKAGMGPVCRAKAGKGDNDVGSDNQNVFYDLPFDPESMDIVCRREGARLGSDGFRKHFNINQLVVHHSPDGFEWGYGGSGPADFALNVLHLFVPPGSDGQPVQKLYRGECSRTAYTLHQDFKREFIAALQEEGGTIHGREIRDWIEANRPDYGDVLDVDESGE